MGGSRGGAPTGRPMQAPQPWGGAPQQAQQAMAGYGGQMRTQVQPQPQQPMPQPQQGGAQTQVQPMQPDQRQNMQRHMANMMRGQQGQQAPQQRWASQPRDRRQRQTGAQAARGLRERNAYNRSNIRRQAPQQSRRPSYRDAIANSGAQQGTGGRDFYGRQPSVRKQAPQQTQRSRNKSRNMGRYGRLI